MKNQLIQIYLWVCKVYDKHPELKYQRLSNNNEPKFTDQELLTIYLFGHLQGHFQQRRIYDYTLEHWLEWFPLLPSYQAFNRRINELSSHFISFIEEFLLEAETNLDCETECLLDSLPVCLAKGSRSSSAKVASEIANKGYCSSKKLYYHGVKLHLLGQRRVKKLPVPQSFALTKASTHDLTALREDLTVPVCKALFADKAYKDKQIVEDLEKQGVLLCTPDKLKRGEKAEDLHSSLWSRFVSAMRQPIESFFNWTIQRSGLQDASKVRSTNGLLVHCFGKLAVCCFLLLFNY